MSLTIHQSRGSLSIFLFLLHIAIDILALLARAFGVLGGIHTVRTSRYLHGILL